jgi:hypothetical protein
MGVALEDSLRFLAGGQSLYTRHSSMNFWAELIVFKFLGTTSPPNQGLFLELKLSVVSGPMSGRDLQGAVESCSRSRCQNSLVS